ncbi:ATP-dependent 6-phosphofructokinase [Persicimonas caeni]|uniref:ATP-dependent 6-phosphofructokinase n=1 Tax=Persicimonas caeni TaxID=2292766 RepID=A0A4Y6PQ08_PERCE|nr:ATP-dependent 6-phosphofructokinase [Persicimonas caeni]QDG50398.1 ATP-dependent 6-phosphofructokinase [Persicimonas caeni]QED31619.1 ATP-dependent 6-phosphofructokinase [Persicimonas caeni]
MRVGILTGGGDCPGLNAVIRSVAKSLMLQCDAEVIGIEEGFLGLIERRTRELSYKDVSGILARGGTVLGTHNKANPFSYFERDGEDVSDEVMEYYEELDLDAIVALGGDGTMSICHRLQEMGMNIVGVPKTIDNDIVATDRTFGFDTAVSIATDAIDRLQTTGQSHKRVMILETMGRYAGWIALHAGIAGGADVILLPELPFSVEEVARVVKERADRQRFTIVCVAEGAKTAEGDMVVKERIEESPDPIRLGGIANWLKEELKPMVDSEIRTVVLGHIQRGGSPTAFDRILATNFGAMAASLVAKEQYGRMVALRDQHLTSVELEKVANKTRTVPEDAMGILAAFSVGTSLGVPGMKLDPSQIQDYKKIS